MAVTESPRVITYAATPVGIAMVIATIPMRFPRTTETVARYAFGVRFDLVAHGTVSHPSPLAMAAYSLLGSGLLAALIISLAGQYLDRGGAPRRVLGWACILIGGFGAVTMAGAVDPFRTVAVVLGAMLLEQSVAMEGTED